MQLQDQISNNSYNVICSIIKKGYSADSILMSKKGRWKEMMTSIAANPKYATRRLEIVLTQIILFVFILGLNIKFATLSFK